MRKALIALAAALVCLLLSRNTWAAESSAATRTKMAIQLPAVRAGEQIHVVARLTTEAGAPLAYERVIFRVGADDDGQTQTDSDGRATWRIRHELPIGTYQIVADFNGSQNLGPSHADGHINVGATTLNIRVDPSLATGSRRAGAVARLTDAAGVPVPAARIVFSVDGARQAELLTDASGTALWPIRPELAAGKHTIEVGFDGQPQLMAAHGSTHFVVATTRLTIQIGAPLSAVAKEPSVAVRLTTAAGAPLADARIVFYVDGTAQGEARTNAAGQASGRIQRALAPGKHTVVAAFIGRSDLQSARASLELDIAATQLTLQFDRARSQGGMRAPIVARLTDASGAPVGKARVVFLVGGERDGEAFTGEDGTAIWRIKRDLPIGTHMVEGIFDGLPRLLGARASTSVAVASTALELRTILASSRVGQPATVIARLADAAGAPAANARIALFVNGVRHGEIRTNANGLASRRLESNLATGTYTVEGVFEGLPGLLPSRTSVPLVVEPAVVEIQTVPALAGVRFALDGRTFVAGDDGIARIAVDRVGEYKLEARPWEHDQSGVHAEFDRWADPVFVPLRTIKIPGRVRLIAGFDVRYLISQEFVDPAGRPIDPKRISSFALTSSYGTRHFFDNVQPRWLQGIHVVRMKAGLAESPVTYAIESVIVDGAEVVNQAQQRFAAHQGKQWRLQLQLYSVRFVARDALFGFPIGSAIHLTYPDGQSRTRLLGPGGEVRIDALARGAYTVRIDAPGLAGPTPAALSHDQEVVLLVLSYLDLGIAGLFLLALALGLLFVGQPRLRMIARDPLAPFRPGTDGRRPVWVWLHDIQAQLRRGIAGVGAAIRQAPAWLWNRGAPASGADTLNGEEMAIAGEQQGALPGDFPASVAASSRTRLHRWLLDPALIFACMLVALGAVGGALARSAAPSTQAIAAQLDRPAGVVPTQRAIKQPIAATAIAPTLAPTAPAATPMPTAAPTAAPASLTRLAFRQNLDRKSNGPDVVQLQQRLRELGYFDYPDNTGYFGAETARALAQFQAQRGLTSTGIADQGTVEALNRCGEDCVDPKSRGDEH